MHDFLRFYELLHTFTQTLVHRCRFAEKTVDVRLCPHDITVQADSPQRRRTVRWPEPQFVGRDGTLLAPRCTKTSGSQFAVGSTKVDCFPERMTSSGCSFIVSVVGRPASLPNNSVICFKRCWPLANAYEIDNFIDGR